MCIRDRRGNVLQEGDLSLIHDADSELTEQRDAGGALWVGILRDLEFVRKALSETRWLWV